MKLKTSMNWQNKLKRTILIMCVMLLAVLCGCESDVREMREANEDYKRSFYELEQTRDELERVQQQIAILEGID